MMLSSLDKNGKATIAAAEAQAALAEGDTPRARQKYEEAGELLERNIAAKYKQSEKQLLRFLAATQFYKGGHYDRALALCGKINEKLLPKNVRPLYPPFLRDVKARTSPEYGPSVRKRLLDLWLAKQHKELLELLAEHPYLIQPRKLALLRAAACERIGDFRAAALFFGKAVKDTPDDPSLASLMAAYPLHLLSQGGWAEAWEYVRWQIEYCPHTVTYINASMVSFRRAVTGPRSERRVYLEEQIKYFERAWESFHLLPESHKNHPRIRSYMAFCLEVTALALFEMDNSARSKQLCDTAIELEPNSSSSWKLRSILDGLFTDDPSAEPSFPDPGRDKNHVKELSNIAPESYDFDLEAQIKTIDQDSVIRRELQAAGI